MKDCYTHKQETWSGKECAKRARYAPKDPWGNRPPKGLISHVGSAYPEYGQRKTYNGGCIRDGEHYRSEYKPLPVIPEGWEFAPLESWGTVIRRKGDPNHIAQPVKDTITKVQ
jgi:hypothetical protein